MNADTRELKIHTVCLMVLAATAIGLALFWLRPVLVPFVLALFFTAGLVPILDLIEERLGAPRLLAVAIAFLAGLVLLFLMLLFIWLSVQSLREDSKVYIKRIKELTISVNKVLEPTRFQLPVGEENGQTTDSAAGGEPNESATTPETDAQVAGSEADNENVEPAPDGDEDGQSDPENQSDKDDSGKSRTDGSAEKQQDEPEALSSATFQSYASHAVALISTTLLDLSTNAVMVLIFMFFMLLGGSTSAIPRGGVWREIEGKIRGYIITKTIISFFTGVAFGLVLWMFGVPLALVFALLAFLLNFIPNIGPVIASLLPLPLILLHPELSLFQMVAVIGLSSAVQVISGNVIEPKIMGDSFELHPISILLTLMFWGILWGIVGMFLAVPMTAAVCILLARFDHTKPVADILAGRFDTLTALLGGDRDSKQATTA